jgi:hypothetical protein
MKSASDLTQSANEIHSSVKYSTLRATVQSSGGPENPMWTIRAQGKEEVLSGPVIKSPYFARVEATGPDPLAEMYLNIAPEAIRIQDSTGAFESVNRRIIAFRRIQKELCSHPILLDSIAPDLDVEHHEENSG